MAHQSINLAATVPFTYHPPLWLVLASWVRDRRGDVHGCNFHPKNFFLVSGPRGHGMPCPYWQPSRDNHLEYTVQSVPKRANSALGIGSNSPSTDSPSRGDYPPGGAKSASLHFQTHQAASVWSALIAAGPEPSCDRLPPRAKAISLLDELNCTTTTPSPLP